MLSNDFSLACVVIVDDVAANSRLLESSLRAFGLRNTLSFSDSAEALLWLQHNPWNLLLLDLDMPAPNGFEILRALAQRDRNRQPVIIVTALNDTDSRRSGLELGANDYLCKPLDLPEPAVSPCTSCAQPCLTACPAGALTGAGYDVPACHTYLDTGAGGDCLAGGCLVRRACPVSQGYARLPEQSAYHMSRFHRVE